MKINGIHRKIETDELLLSITKDTDILNEQFETKLQEILKFRRSKQTETFSFDTPLNLEYE